MFSKIHNVRAGASDGKGGRSSITTVTASGLQTHTLPSWPLIFWEFTYQYRHLWQINCIYPDRGVSLGLKELGSSVCSDGLSGGSVVKNPSANAGNVGSILGSGRSPEKEMVTHSGIIAREIPQTEEPGGLPTVRGVAKSWTRVSD